MKVSRLAPTDFASIALALTLIGFVSTLTACEDTNAVADLGVASTLARGDATETEGLRRASSETALSRLEAIRARADRAFDEMDGSSRGQSGQRTTRSTNRIGPQPWPADLPTMWPRLESARVLADTRRDGDRLLLVDLPGSPAEAAAEYGKALRSRGYSIDQTESARVGRAIHAESPDHEAVLTFFPRDEITRLEILFLGKSAS